jgi:predicted AAA+ superfamily ATPase
MVSRAYIPRVLGSEIKKAAREFPVVVLTGPRQTGKSTLLKNIFSEHRYFSLDHPLTLAAAQEDPKAFLSQKPMLVDEIQYFPELMRYIKLEVDQDRSRRGDFILTGSQVFPLMAGLSESLAGRAMLYELLPLSYEELGITAKKIDAEQVYQRIFQGMYPEVAVHGVAPDRFYSSYLSTYLEKDIRQVQNIHDLRVFQNFMELLAARCGGLLNLSEVTKDCGVSFDTGKRWLSLLETTRIVYLLRPFSKKRTQRLIKSPKLYFTDTGLVSWILRYPNASTLQQGPMKGMVFENALIVEILKYQMNHRTRFEMSFYRDSNQNELDLVLELPDKTFLIEIKSTQTPKSEHFSTLKRLLPQFPKSQGYLLSLTSHSEKISENIWSLPWSEWQKIFNLKHE